MPTQHWLRRFRPRYASTCCREKAPSTSPSPIHSLWMSWIASRAQAWRASNAKASRDHRATGFPRTHLRRGVAGARCRRLCACWEGGSVAMGRADEFSDIDLYVVADVSHHERVLDEFEAI